MEFEWGSLSSVLFWVLSLSLSIFFSFGSLGQNWKPSHVIHTWRVSKPRLSVWSARMRMGTFWLRVSLSSPAWLSSSKHLALVSTSVSMQGHFSQVFLVLDTPPSPPPRLYGHYAAYGEAYQVKLSSIPSHHFQSKAWIMRLCCPYNCLISSVRNRVTNCLEWRLTTFIDLDLKLFGVFLKSA